MLGGEGRVGVEWWHENHIRDQSSQAAPPSLCSRLASEDSVDGLSFSLLSTLIRQLSQKSKSRADTTEALFLKQKDGENFKLFFTS